MSPESKPLDVHTWFGLSYASYLVVNRSVLQSAPMEWQYRFTALMDELWDEFRDVEEPAYCVQCRDGRGRFIKDPIPHYNRGRTFIQGRTKRRDQRWNPGSLVGGSTP